MSSAPPPPEGSSEILTEGVAITIDWRRFPKLAATFAARPQINVYWVELRELLREAFAQGHAAAWQAANATLSAPPVAIAHPTPERRSASELVAIAAIANRTPERLSASELVAIASRAAPTLGEVLIDGEAPGPDDGGAVFMGGLADVCTCFHRRGAHAYRSSVVVPALRGRLIGPGERQGQTGGCLHPGCHCQDFLLAPQVPPPKKGAPAPMIVSETFPLNSPRVLGFDTDTRLTAVTASALFLAGFSFAKRYVGLERGKVFPGDLDLVESTTITNSGLWLLSVQHGRSSGWSAQAGASDGAAAAINHLGAGLPVDSTLSCDLESQGMTLTQAEDYGSRWFESATSEGCTSLELYVGAGVPLSSSELYHKLPFRLYWHSGSDVPDVDRRGYATFQLLPFEQVVAGVSLDLVVIASDRFGNRPRGARRAP
jgi:hypothetical protein